MNSWHSFSPNGRWLVFSSKSRSPYTQMYLTHIDENGNDSPAILIDNATAANRAVNIPEFVNIPPDGLRPSAGRCSTISRRSTAPYTFRSGHLPKPSPCGDRRRDFNRTTRRPKAVSPRALLMTGHREEAGTHFRKAAELKLRAAIADNPAMLWRTAIWVGRCWTRGVSMKRRRIFAGRPISTRRPPPRTATWA